MVGMGKRFLPMVVGFAAAGGLIVWIGPAPPHVTTLRGVLFLYALAMSQVALVAGSSALAALGAWWLMKPRTARLVWPIASRAVWVVPLYLFLAVGSAWAVVAAVLLTLGIVHVGRNTQSAVPQKSTLSSGWQVVSCVVAGAAIELTVLAAGTRRAREAAPLAALAALIIGWRATKPGPSGHPARGLITIFVAFVLTSGALVWRVIVPGDDGFLGYPVDPAIAASLYTLQKTFGGASPVPYVPNMPAVAKGGDADVQVKGMAHRGIYLWPDVKKETTLVPPLPMLGPRAFGKHRQTALTIPFYGAYWFFRPPYLQPPVGSLEVHGSPLLRQFLSNDRSPLWEEAHQSLQTAFDLSCCSRIDVDISNGDRQAELIEIGLTLVDTSQLPHVRQLLGVRRLASKPVGSAAAETLRFHIPQKARIRRMTELVVRFRLVWPRVAESAQVAIERFRLVPAETR